VHFWCSHKITIASCPRLRANVVTEAWLGKRALHESREADWSLRVNLCSDAFEKLLLHLPLPSVVAAASEHHRHPVPICDLNRCSVSTGTTRLHDGGHTRCCGGGDPFCKWKVGVRGHHGASRAITCALKCNINRNAAVHLRCSNAERGGVSRNDNCIGANVSHDSPCKECVGELFQRGSALRHHTEFAAFNGSVICGLHQERITESNQFVSLRVFWFVQQHPKIWTSGECGGGTLVCHSWGDHRLVAPSCNLYGHCTVDRRVQRNDCSRCCRVIGFKCALECAEGSLSGCSTNRISVANECRTWDWEVSDESRASIKIKDVVQCGFAPLHKLCAKYTCAVSQRVLVRGGALMRILTVLEGANAL